MDCTYVQFMKKMSHLKDFNVAYPASIIFTYCKLPASTRRPTLAPKSMGKNRLAVSTYLNSIVLASSAFQSHAPKINLE